MKWWLNIFDRHDFAFRWSFAEMAPTVSGVGYDWAVEQTGKSLDELIDSSGGDPGDEPLFTSTTTNGSIHVYARLWRRP